uniref:non-specific serine/threonine protein kinase n=1 Tax=Phallusia mammillata TaxID=59560 RepID=A0A6F9DUP9_9ASCI|nr:TP53-regulating kinase-like [Phallusia mammillata]
MEFYCQNSKIISQGAEAKVYEGVFCDRPVIIKERFSKKYRLPEIDEKLTKKRLIQEIRALQRCRKVGICTPAIYFVDTVRNILLLQHINGLTVRDLVSNEKKLNPQEGYANLYPVIKSIGRILAIMHDANIIHGDLTTSNMIYQSSKESNKIGNIFMIDFGLSSSSAMPEDKGVDLYVLERAFLSTHPGSEQLFNVLLQAYKDNSKNPSPVINKLDEVRMRGRKRTMVG